MQLLFVALLYLYPQVITCSPLHCSFLWHYHYLAVVAVAVDTRDNGICIRCPLSKLDDRIRHESNVWWLFGMESTICNKNHSFYCTRRILAGAFTIFVKVKKALAAALSSNITHMFGQDQKEPSIWNLNKRLVSKQRRIITKKMIEMVLKQYINNTPVRSSLCLCPKLLPQPNPF